MEKQLSNLCFVSDNRRLVYSSETLLLKCEVWSVGNKKIYEHRLGDAAPLPFSDRSDNSTTSTSSILWGDGNDAIRRYSLHEQGPVYGYLFNEAVTGSIDFADVGRSWGRTLRALHESSSYPPAKEAHIPRSLSRASAWLYREEWANLNEHLDSSHFLKIRQWVQETTVSDSLRLAHGSPGFVNWLTDKGGADGVLLTGEDTGYATWDYDLGWVLGEFAELYAFYPAVRGRLRYLQLGLLEGYGLRTNRSFDTTIAFRLIQHAYDWHHYANAGWQQAQLLINLAKTYLAR